MGKDKLKHVNNAHGIKGKHGKGKKALRDSLVLHLLGQVNMDLLKFEEIKERIEKLNNYDNGNGTI